MPQYKVRTSLLAKIFQAVPNAPLKCQSNKQNKQPILKYRFFFCLICLIHRDVTNSEVSNGALITTQELLARRGARTLFCGVWTCCVKVLEFQRFLKNKN